MGRNGPVKFTYCRAEEPEKSKLAFEKFNQLKAQKKEKGGWEVLVHIAK